MENVAIEELNELFILDESTGKLYWKVNRQPGIKIGDEAGSVTEAGYIRAYVKGKRCTAHRIVWAMTKGEWPKDQLDHINGNRSDNRPSNLREASNQTNSKNKGMLKSNTSGHKGVSWVPHLQKWKSEITVDRKRIYLGVFTDIEEASAAYEEAATRYFLEFRRKNE